LSIFFLFVLLLIIVWVNIGLGSVNIPQSELIKILFTQQEVNSTWSYIIWEYRLPKAVTAILVGSALGISGMLMQTLFKNPLAGPYVLGLSSGASLGVAILILGGSFLGGWFSILLFSKWALVIFSSLGSLIVLIAILSTAIKIKDTMALLIIGLMFASLTGAVVSVLSYFSPASNLQQYIFWSFGSLGNLNWQEVSILFLCFFIGVLICVFCLKSLNALLLGEKYAKSLGVNIKKNRFMVIFSTSILAGSVTAFAGPIAFIGLAIPHLMRQLIKTNNHFLLMPSVVFGGAIIMLICDTIAQLPGSEHTLPINAITSIFGAPIVIWLLVKKQKIIF